MNTKNDLIDTYLKELEIFGSHNSSIDIEFTSQKKIEKIGNGTSSGTIRYSSLITHWGRLAYYPDFGNFSLEQKLDLGNNECGYLTFDLTEENLKKFPVYIKSILRLVASDRQTRALNYSNFHWF